MTQYAAMFVSRTTGIPHYFKVSGSSKQSIENRIVRNASKWKNVYNMGGLYTKNELGRQVYIDHDFPLKYTKYDEYKHTNWGQLPTRAKSFVINSVWKSRTKPVPKSIY